MSSIGRRITQSSEVKVTNSPLVFVGYGVVAPEYGWNDYAGVDVKGKTVVILVNDPGNEDANPDPDLLQGQGDDLLRPLDLQIRRSRAPGRRRRDHRA